MGKIKIPMLDLKREYEYMKKDIDEAIKRCLEHQQWILGPEVKELEEKIAQYVGVKHCIGVASGTDALLLSLRALAIKIKKQEFWSKEDLIITTPFTFVATADTILRSGATPLFVDIDLQTYNIDPNKIEQAIRVYGKKVVGIIPVHLYGLACDMDRIMEIALNNNLFVVEDCAQAFGSMYKGKKVGSFGNTGCFSFFPSKNLGAFGDAGAVTTDDDELAELIRILRVHGGKDKYNVDYLGYKSRLDTLQAAILLAKLKYIDDFNNRRRKIAEIYIEKLKDTKNLRLPHIPSEDYFHTFHQFTIFVGNNFRDTLQKTLNEEGIQTMIYYPVPLHKMKVFANRCEMLGELKNSEIVSMNVLSLPIEPLIMDEEINKIIETLHNINHVEINY